MSCFMFSTPDTLELMKKGKQDMKNIVKIEELVKSNKTTDTFIIAEKFGKRHSDVLRAITNTKKKLSKDFIERNIALNEYTDEIGRKLPYYELTRDGFVLLAMGFTSPEAYAWKEKFITAFNLMEKSLMNQLPTVAQVDMKAIGGMVKKCAAVGVRDEITDVVNSSLKDFFNPNPLENSNMLKLYSMMRRMINESVDDILCSADVKDLENRRLKRALKKANSTLSRISETAKRIEV